MRWGQPGAQAEQRLGSHWGSRDMKLGRKWKLKADTKVRKGFLGKNWETGVLLCKLLNLQWKRSARESALQREGGRVSSRVSRVFSVATIGLVAADSL